MGMKLLVIDKHKKDRICIQTNTWDRGEFPALKYHIKSRILRIEIAPDIRSVDRLRNGLTKSEVRSIYHILRRIARTKPSQKELMSIQDLLLRFYVTRDAYAD